MIFSWSFSTPNSQTWASPTPSPFKHILTKKPYLLDYCKFTNWAKHFLIPFAAKKIAIFSYLDLIILKSNSIFCGVKSSESSLICYIGFMDNCSSFSILCGFSSSLFLGSSIYFYFWISAYISASAIYFIISLYYLYVYYWVGSSGFSYGTCYWDYGLDYLRILATF